MPFTVVQSSSELKCLAMVACKISRSNTIVGSCVFVMKATAQVS